MADILQTVKTVLSSPAARKIDFHLGLINVDAAGLAAIHNLVAVGTIVVKVVTMKKGVAAVYSNKFNTLKFPRESYGATPLERAAILHECIHALQDMYGGGYYHPKGGSRFVSASENEAAAYVADQLFYLYETGGGLQSGNPIVDKAGVIAKRIRNQRGAFVTTAEATDLRWAIVSNSEYDYQFSTLTGANGP